MTGFDEAVCSCDFHSFLEKFAALSNSGKVLFQVC